jgi:hypothetical protein
VGAKYKRWDITLWRCASRGMGSEPKAVQVSRGWVLANGCGVAQSRIDPGTGTSKDGRQHSTELDLKIDNLQAGRGIRGLRRKRANFGEE